MEGRKLEQDRRANSQLTSGPQNFDYNVAVDETENSKPVLKCIGVRNPPLKVVSRTEATTPSCSRTSGATPSCSKTAPSTSTNARNNLIPVVKYQHRMPYRLVTQNAVPPTNQGPNRAFIMSNQVVNVHSNKYARTSYQNQTTCSDQQNPARNFTQVPRETPSTARAAGGTQTGVLKNYYPARRDAKGYESNQSGTQNPFTMTNAENIPEPYGSPKKRKSIKIFKKKLTAVVTGGDSTKKMTPSSSVSNFLEQDMLAKEIEVLESLDDQSLTVLVRKVIDLTNKMHGDYLAAQLEEYLGVEPYNEIADHGITPKYYEFLAEKRHADKEIFSHPMDSSSVINQDANATYGRANFLAVDVDMAQKIPNITVCSVKSFDEVKMVEGKNKGPSFVGYQADAATTAPLASQGTVFNRNNEASSLTSLTKLKDTVGINGPVKIKDFALRTDARSAEDQKKEADIYISRKIAEFKKIERPTADVFEEIFNFKDFDPSRGLPEKIFESPEADMNREWFKEKCRPRKILQGDGIEANEMQGRVPPPENVFYEKKVTMHGDLTNKVVEDTACPHEEAQSSNVNTELSGSKPVKSTSSYESIISSNNTEADVVKTGAIKKMKTTDGRQHIVTSDKDHKDAEIRDIDFTIQTKEENIPKISQTQSGCIQTCKEYTLAQPDQEAAKLVKNRSGSPDLETSINDLAQLLLSMQDMPVTKNRNETHTRCVSNESFETFAQNTVNSVIVENEDSVIVDEVADKDLEPCDVKKPTGLKGGKIAKSPQIDDQISDKDFTKNNTCKSSVTIADDADDCVLMEIESGPGTENVYQSKSSNVYKVSPCISSKVSVSTGASTTMDVPSARELGACKQKIFSSSSEPNDLKASKNKTIVRAPLQQKENIKSLTFNVAKKRSNCRSLTDSSNFTTVGSSSFPSPNISKNINSGFSKPIFPDDGKNFPTSVDVEAATALAFMSRKFSLDENRKALSKKMSLSEVSIELVRTDNSVTGKAMLPQKKGEFDTVKYVKNKPREECKDEYVKKTLPDVKNVDDVETAASPAGNTSDLFKNKYGSIISDVISQLNKSSNLKIDTVRMEGNRSHDNRKLTSPQNVHVNSDPLGDVKNGEDNECIFVGTDQYIVGTPLSRKSGEIRQPRSLVRRRIETLKKKISELIAMNLRMYSHLKMLVDVINYDLEDENFDDSTLKGKTHYLMAIYNQIVNRKLEAFSSEEVRNLAIAHEQVLMAIGRVRNQNSKKDVAGLNVAVASTNQFITPDDAKEDKCGRETHGEKGKLCESPQSEQMTLLKPEKTYSKARNSILGSLPSSVFENTSKTVEDEAVFSKHATFSDEIRKSSLDRDRHFEDETIPGERPPSPEMVIVKPEPLDSPEMQRTYYPRTCCQKRKARDRTPSTEDELPVSKRPWDLRKHTVAQRTPPSRRTPDSQCTYPLRSRINGSKSLSGNHT